METPHDEQSAKRPIALTHDELRFLLWSGIAVIVLLFIGAAVLENTNEGDATAVIVAIVGVGGALVGAVVALFNKVSAVQSALNGDMDTRLRTIVTEVVKQEIAHVRDELFDRLDEFTGPPHDTGR